MLKIWGRKDAPNVQKVLWGCEELGLAYERVDLGGPFGGAQAPAYLAKNPNGLVPTLEDGDFVLWESHAILRYLASVEGGAVLYPCEPHARGHVDQWMDWQAVHQAAAVRALVRATLTPGGPGPGAADAIAEGERIFAILEGQLSRSPFAAGGQFTLADIVLGIGAFRWLSLPIERTETPAIAAWVARLELRPARIRLKGPPS